VAFLAGLSSILYVTSTTSIVQVEADQSLHGRILSLQTVLLVGPAEIGRSLVGWLAECSEHPHRLRWAPARASPPRCTASPGADSVEAGAASAPETALNCDSLERTTELEPATLTLARLRRPEASVGGTGPAPLGGHDGDAVPATPLDQRSTRGRQECRRGYDETDLAGPTGSTRHDPAP
jgi:hypothetical protein